MGRIRSTVTALPAALWMFCRRVDALWTWLRLWVLVPTVVVALVVTAQWWPGYTERVLGPDEIRAVDGHSFYVEPLGLAAPPLFAIWADTNEQPSRSLLVLSENGRPLLPHSQHATIVSAGGGT